MALTITQRTRSRIALVSGVLLVLALGAAQFAAPIGTVWRDVALVAASVLAGFPIAVRAWAALRAKAFSIDLLVTIAVIGALIIGEYVESAVVSFLFLFGEGPVRGFAVTLTIGLLANVFTAVFVSRAIFDFELSGRRQLETLSI